MAPVSKMYTLGHAFMPPTVHAGGLRYHGMSPLVSHIVNMGYITPRAVKQVPVFKGALDFARTEGIIPAPESSHAIRVVIDEAEKCKLSGEKKLIVFSLSGHGYFDMTSYEKYITGQLQDYEFPEEQMKDALNHLPQVKE